MCQRRTRVAHESKTFFFDESKQGAKRCYIIRVKEICTLGKTAVLYRSKYGSTGQYAKWIAEETGADLFRIPHVSVRDLARYDTIIVGGGLYAGGMLGASFLKRNFAAIADKRIIVFSVGASFANEKNIAAIKARLLAETPRPVRDAASRLDDPQETRKRAGRGGERNRRDIRKKRNIPESR